MAELLAFHAVLHLLHTLQLRGAVYSDCLGAAKKIARRWFPGGTFQEAGAALVAANRAHLSDKITIQWIKGPRNALTPFPPDGRGNSGAYLYGGLFNQEQGHQVPYSLTHTHPRWDSLDFFPRSLFNGFPCRLLAVGRSRMFTTAGRSTFDIKTSPCTSLSV